MLPSLFSFTFGSFGDIVTVIQLLKKIVGILSDSKGASLDYQDLVEELRGYETVLSRVQYTVVDPKTPVIVARELLQEVDVCRALLHRIHKQILRYRESLRKGGSNNMMIDSWRKIGWTLVRGSEVDRIRERLAGSMQRMETCISFSTKYVDFSVIPSDYA